MHSRVQNVISIITILLFISGNVDPLYLNGWICFSLFSKMEINDGSHNIMYVWEIFIFLKINKCNLKLDK
jgi:hypothetical protein